MTNALGRIRSELLDEMEAAEAELGRLRMRVERIESDLRIGLPEPPEYAGLKGRLLPQAEARIVELYRNLAKIEDRINLARRPPGHGDSGRPSDP